MARTGAAFVTYVLYLVFDDQMGFYRLQMTMQAENLTDECPESWSTRLLSLRYAADMGRMLS